MLSVTCYSLFLVWPLDLSNCTLPAWWNGGLQGRVWVVYNDLYLYGWQSQSFQLLFSTVCYRVSLV